MHFEKILSLLANTPPVIWLGIACAGTLVLFSVGLAVIAYVVVRLRRKPDGVGEKPIPSPKLSVLKVLAARAPKKAENGGAERPSYWMGTNIEKKLIQFRNTLARRDILSSDATYFLNRIVAYLNNNLVPDYGERFQVLISVPTDVIIQPQANADENLVRVLRSTRVDFLICVRDFVIRPAVAILVDDSNFVDGFEGYNMIRADEILSKRPMTALAETMLAQAAALHSVGLSVYFATSKNVEAVFADDKNFLILSYLESDIERALNDTAVHYL